MVQWLRLCASTVGASGLIPGWGTKILYAVWHGQKKIKKDTGSRACLGSNPNSNFNSWVILGKSTELF